MAKVILNAPITTDRYGLHFVNGEAHTTNIYLINKLIRKGVKVEIIEEKPKEKTIDEMTVAELKVYATTKDIEIPSDVKNKADIVDFIKNYKKEDDGKEESPDGKNPGEPGVDESDKNPETENPGEPGMTKSDLTGQENQ